MNGGIPPTPLLFAREGTYVSVAYHREELERMKLLKEKMKATKRALEAALKENV
jgi:hypothetical protein